jgi:hypothetical protein
MFILSVYAEYVISRPFNGWLQLLSTLVVIGATVGLLKYTAEFLTKNKKQETND